MSGRVPLKTASIPPGNPQKEDPRTATDPRQKDPRAAPRATPEGRQGQKCHGKACQKVKSKAFDQRHQVASTSGCEPQKVEKVKSGINQRLRAFEKICLLGTHLSLEHINQWLRAFEETMYIFFAHLEDRAPYLLSLTNEP